MSPLSFGCSCMREKTSELPSGGERGVQLVGGRVDPGGHGSCAPVAALTIRISKPWPVTYSS